MAIHAFEARLVVFLAALAHLGCGSSEGRNDMFGGGDGDGADGTADDGGDDGGSGGDDGSGDGDDGGDGGGDDGGSGDDGGNGDDGGGGDDGSGDDGGIKYDVGDGTGGPPPACDPDVDDCGCNAVDVLFVIDNSTSMGSYQSALAAAAPGFASALFNSLPLGTDLHVGVTTTSFYRAFNGGTSPGDANCAPYYAGAGMTGRDDLYDYYHTPDTMPNNENGGQGRLFTYQGRNYFEVDTSGDPTAMTNWLTGAITSVGEGGSVWEMVAAGMAYPFHPANAAANDGFLRDAGAVLVIFALTDEVGNSPEDVDVYHDMIVNAKAACGGDQCVVTGGIMRPCLQTATDTRIYPLLSSFGKTPVIGDIDADPSTFGDVLGDTLAQVIAQTCEEIPPVG